MGCVPNRDMNGSNTKILLNEQSSFYISLNSLKWNDIQNYKVF